MDDHLGRAVVVSSSLGSAARSRALADVRAGRASGRGRSSRRAGRSARRRRAPADEAPYPLGDRVEHETWGAGQVLGYEDDVVTVLFDEGGYRTLSLDLVRQNRLLRPAD